MLVTGGCGFIGSAVLRNLVAAGYKSIVNVDALTYAGNEATVAEESKYSGYHFEHADIRDLDQMRVIFSRHRPDVVKIGRAHV